MSTDEIHLTAERDLNLLEEAAEYRACGYDWDSTALKVGMKARELRQRIKEEKPKYKKLLAEYRREAVGEAASECLFVLRKRIRSDDDKIAIASSTALLKVFMAILRHSPKDGSGGEDPFAVPFSITPTDFMKFVDAEIEDREYAAKQHAAQGDDHGNDVDPPVTGSDDEPQRPKDSPPATTQESPPGAAPHPRPLTPEGERGAGRLTSTHGLSA